MEEFFIEEKQKELVELVKPVVKWLNDNSNPHSQLQITTAGFEVLVGALGVQITDFIKD